MPSATAAMLQHKPRSPGGVPNRNTEPFRNPSPPLRATPEPIPIWAQPLWKKKEEKQLGFSQRAGAQAHRHARNGSKPVGLRWLNIGSWRLGAALWLVWAATLSRTLPLDATGPQFCRNLPADGLSSHGYTSWCAKVGAGKALMPCE